jgi:hypothetical protein
MTDMRDFRDAKAMAHTLRAALAAMGMKITISQSLELTAVAFGVADWNTLAAAIREAANAARKKAPPPSLTHADPELPFSAKLAVTVNQALAHANQRSHEYSTLEHLLLALTEDADAAAVMRAGEVDLDTLRERLISYIDNDLKKLVIEPTAGFQRSVQRAADQARALRRAEVSGANVRLAIFPETNSPAAHLLVEQGLSFQDTANFIARGIGR